MNRGVQDRSRAMTFAGTSSGAASICFVGVIAFTPSTSNQKIPLVTIPSRP
jgi:hypothetical protein